jgi:hypothetical protein
MTGGVRLVAMGASAAEYGMGRLRSACGERP